MATILEDESLMNKCRICLTTAAPMNRLFDPYLEDFSLAQVLRDVSIINIENDDKLPKMICYNCTNAVVSFKNFVKLFKNTEDYLKRICCESDSLKVEGSIQEEIVDFNLFESVVENDEINDDDDEFKDYTYTEESNEIADENKERLKPNEDDDDDDDGFETITSIKYSCDICGDCYLFKSGFSHHMLMAHNICVQVNQYEQYSSTVSFKIPKMSSIEEKLFSKRTRALPSRVDDYSCRKCKENFKNGDELKIHLEIHKTYRCDQCGAAFMRNSYLRDHLLKHSSDKCYECKTCGAKFKYRSALAIHRRDHGGNYPGHMCETCGKNFKEKGTLKTHIKLKHTNERNFSCTGCGLTFKLKAARDKHFMRKHTDNRTKDFVCATCGMAYLNKETLKRHMNDKHSNLPNYHWCTVCEKSFTMRSNLLKHLRNRHHVITKQD